MRFLLMHRLDERAPEWNPDQEFVEKVGAFVQEAAERGVLLTGEGVHPSEKGARVRKTRDAGIATTDGPFSETAEQVGGYYEVRTDDLDDLMDVCKILSATGDAVEVHRKITGQESA